MATMRRSSLVHLYPARWRRRYGDEVSVLLEDEPLSAALVVDVLRGAFVAHLRYHPEPQESVMSIRRLQTTMAVIAVMVLLPTLVLLAAAVGRGLTLTHAEEIGASSATFVEPWMAVAAGLIVWGGSVLALVLGLAALGWRLRNDAELRGDLAQLGQVAMWLARRPVLVAGSFAIVCAIGVLIAVPVILILGPH